MIKNSKRALYENIMRNVAKQVKKSLNEQAQVIKFTDYDSYEMDGGAEEGLDIADYTYEIDENDLKLEDFLLWYYANNPNEIHVSIDIDSPNWLEYFDWNKKHENNVIINHGTDDSLLGKLIRNIENSTFDWFKKNYQEELAKIYFR